jgi:branched-chain amino acid transport system substrate-binding protein
MKRLIAGLAVASIAAAPAFAADAIKIGFVTTFSGPTAALGNDMRDGFMIAKRRSATHVQRCVNLKGR